MTCFACAAGKATNAEGLACESCPAGTYSARTGKTGCDKCPGNSVAESIGQTLCTECLPGSTNLVFNTSSDAFEYSATTCTSAPVGFYVDPLTRKITPCPSGTFNDQPGGKSCENRWSLNTMVRREN